MDLVVSTATPGELHGTDLPFAATMRDLRYEPKDDALDELLAACLEPEPAERPDSLTLLQRAREKLMTMLDPSVIAKYYPEPFPHRPQAEERDYLSQTLMELLERAFYVYKCSLPKVITESAPRVRLLIGDGTAAREKIVDKAGLRDSLELHMVLGERVQLGRLIDQGKIVTSCFDTFDFTLLHVVAYENWLELARKLLGLGLDRRFIDQQNANRRTALTNACYKGNVEIVRGLLGVDAALEIPDIEGATALHRAAEGNHLVIVGLLLDKGAQINAYDREHSTPLHKASARGHQAVVELLLDKGADANALDSNGMTAAHVAGLNGHEKLGRTEPTYLWTRRPTL